ncbi:holin family protein [uncultured Selenomonas sp.]|uniref:phage holin family protein n=1 Tax=uncultured Selenomonas sp. TaxID=159275 RepID=UPI0025D38BA4|nr:phage holin family protein [uncultured Selenomonas sp.]
MDYSLDIRAWAAGLGAIVGGFVGGEDPLILALVIFVSVDCITGVLCGIAEKKLSSETGFRGICQKVFIFLLVGVANALDQHIIGSGSVLRSAVICFYISNEGISIIENAARIGLPVPEHLRALLEQLKKK